MSCNETLFSIPSNGFYDAAFKSVLGMKVDFLHGPEIAADPVVTREFSHLVARDEPMPLWYEHIIQ